MEEFKSRRGYDLTPFLLYVLKDTNTYSGDSKIAAQAYNDFYQTVSDLYVNYRLKPLQQWANKLGLQLRVQPYTASLDSSYAASFVDIPEGESLGFDGDPDAFRVLATGRYIAGKTTILSDELGAFFGKAYGVTWKFLLNTANHDMSLGVSQIVIHGFPYQTSQTSVWPGFAPFTPFANSNGFADAWGPRQPQWRFVKTASNYLANSQKILQEGGPSVDVAILNEDWGCYSLVGRHVAQWRRVLLPIPNPRPSVKAQGRGSKPTACAKWAGLQGSCCSEHRYERRDREAAPVIWSKRSANCFRHPSSRDDIFILRECQERREKSQRDFGRYQEAQDDGLG